MTIHSDQCKALAVEFAFVGAAFIFVVLRIYIRIIHFRKLSVADVLTIVSWLCLFTSALCDFYTKEWGLWDPRLKFGGSSLPDYREIMPENLKNVVKGLKILYASITVLYTGFFAVKAAFLLQYFEIFPPSRRNLRIALVCVSVIVAISYIVSVGLSLFYCGLPLSKNWSLDPEKECMASPQMAVYGFINVAHIITDFSIYLLPFWLLPSLLWSPTWNPGTPPPRHRLARHRLIPVITIFALGLIVVVVTVVRMICVGDSTSLSFFAAFISAELGVSIALCCCFTIKHGWDIVTNRRRRKNSPISPMIFKRASVRRSKCSRSRVSSPMAFFGVDKSDKTPAVVTNEEDVEPEAVGEMVQFQSRTGSTTLGSKARESRMLSTVGRSFIDGLEDGEDELEKACLGAPTRGNNEQHTSRSQSALVVARNSTSLTPLHGEADAILGIGRSSLNAPDPALLKAIDEKGNLALGNLTFGDPEDHV